MHKKIFIAGMAIVSMLSLAGCGETTSTTSTTSTTAPDAASTGMSAGILSFANGKVMVTGANGSNQAITQDTTLPNGTKVTMDGNVTLANGVMEKLEEGAMINADGTLSEHGFYYLMLNDPAVTGMTFKGGAMMFVKAGKMIPMDFPVMLSNESVVNLDGGIVGKDFIHLTEGQTVMPDGTIN